MTTLTTAAGASDGRIRALFRPEEFDPTGGFIGHPELAEAARAEYCAAYEIAYMATLHATMRVVVQQAEVRP